MKTRRKWGSKLPNLLQAALFAAVSVGGLSAGLSITTYTVSKANELMFGNHVVVPDATNGSEKQCLYE